ncbi:MAG: helicase-related protein [Candidatus Woesebacteria bacterium]|jgi:hypothetical protein
MSVPKYDLPLHPRFRLGRNNVHILKVVDFLKYVIDRDNLSIAEYLNRMGQDPFFLVAATGLGKTVAVPLHVFVRLMQAIGDQPNPQPRVWVVEPRIPIAVDQARFMNLLWHEYLAAKGERPMVPLFGCISSASGNFNPNAPIKFVTTGIFEQMALEGELLPNRDRVIIDEAHVTVEQNPGVELGIALTSQAGVVVDYMSATVDTTTLADDLGVANINRADKQRFVVWRHNLFEPMTDALPKVIEATLINPDPNSEYFPKIGEYPHAKDVLDAVLAPNTSHGMMVIVNSFAGDTSDVASLSAKVKKQFPNLPVLELASEVVRDAKREQAFKQRLQAIEAAEQNYVIFATSVVEMGITFGTLDFVATMDSGYQNETIGNVTFPVEAPLGVNSLLQRFGRTGRKRPGIAYTSREVGADYSELEDDEFNSPNILKYESLRYPMATAPLTALAYYACGQEWERVDNWVASLQLPSRIEDDEDRMQDLTLQIQMLDELKITEYGRLTDFGLKMKRWIGQADLAHATQLQRRLEEGCELPELMFWVVVTALSNVPLVTMRANDDFFVNHFGPRLGMDHAIEIWSDCLHEDIAMFEMICNLASILPAIFLGSNSVDLWTNAMLSRWCNVVGAKKRNVIAACKTISDTWKLFCKINAKTDEFVSTVVQCYAGGLAQMPWADFLLDLPEHDIYEQLLQMHGIEDVQICAGRDDQLCWQIAEVSGQISQDDTPVRLIAGKNYVGQLIPSRKTVKDEVTWQLAHIGALVAPEPKVYTAPTARIFVEEPNPNSEYHASDDEIELFLRWIKRTAMPYVKSKLFRRRT